MPGWTATIEALQRGQHHATSTIDIGNAMCVMVPSLGLLGESINIAMLIASISLAATVRKLAWPLVQRNPAEACKTTATLPTGHDTGGDGLLDELEQRDGMFVEMVQGFFPDFVKAVVGLDRVLPEVVKGCDGSRLGGHKRLKYALPSDQTKEVGDTAASCSSPYSLLPVLIHQLQAVLLVIIAHIFLRRLECSDIGKDEWISNILSGCEGFSNTNLVAFARSLMGNSSSPLPRSQAQISELCEEYAVTHFHGRLTPGCCYLGCTSLSGVSEAALKTQLCSGCRRARYCSVGCQKGAWKEGRHSVVCTE